MADNTLDGFQVLKIKFKEDSAHAHQIFFKPHSVRVLEPTKPTDRTLFCANIPPWLDKEPLKRIFQVESVLGTHLKYIYYLQIVKISKDTRGGGFRKRPNTS